MSNEIYPLFFEPVYKGIMWGGNLLESFADRELPTLDLPIAESWEIVDRDDAQSVVSNGELKGKTIRELIQANPTGIVGAKHKSDEVFPLLVKIIDAGKRLSLQVHPDDEACKKFEGSEPKTEAWYILGNEEDAEIMAGLSANATSTEFREKMNGKEVEALLQIFPSRKGDAYFIPTGRIHAIGGGNLIFEVQQNSNTTFRVSDWGRVGADGKPRELHVEESLESINFKDKSVPLIRKDLSESTRNQKISVIGQCPYFEMTELRIREEYFSATTDKSFHMLTATECDFTLTHKKTDYLVKKGDTVYLPAALGSYEIYPEEGQTISALLTTLKV